MVLSKFARLRGARLFAWPCRLLVLMLLTGTPSAQAQSDAVRSACDAAQKIALPRRDLPDASAALSLKGCDAEALYYGFGKTPDFRRARQCAYLERGIKDDTGGFGGAPILAMLYANGLGVVRNLPLALKFSCEGGWAGPEIEARVADLAALAQAPGKTRFDWCDEGGSGYMVGVCADRDERFKSAERKRRLNALVVRWNTAQQSAFVSLQRAAEHFFDLRSTSEVDLSGTSRDADIVREEDRLDQQFLSDVTGFERGRLPFYSHDAFVKADRQLTQMYAQTLSACANAAPMYAVTVDGLRNTQRAWLAYRGAWARFGAQAYPGVSEDSWSGWLTMRRIHQLRDFTELLRN